MKELVGLKSLERSGSGATVTIGTFDGVHIGHRALMARTVQRARENGTAAVAVTWDRHPMQTLRPDRVPPLLSAQHRKMELLRETDLDVVVVLPFDDDLSSWAPERFVADILVDGVGARHVVVGEGWRFGHKAAGDTDLLTKLGAGSGFTVEPLPLAEAEGGPVSSTRIRQAVAAGDLHLVRSLLGRPFDIDGEVIPGEDRGTSLGYPTANIDPDGALALPPQGIYAGRGRAHDGFYPAAIDVGVNPTFGGDPERTPLRIEPYLLDFEGDLYGRVLRVEFWSRLRDELRFASVGDLVAQMKKDVDDTRRIVGETGSA
ncbi:MAG: bifunctional riboflavin kinase/FAD synthetase [Actinobacteria bacterium]|nr:bifunctional riboflavin kinase/FAD synthetase [Actinomycetota bacterium]